MTHPTRTTADALRPLGSFPNTRWHASSALVDMTLAAAPGTPTVVACEPQDIRFDLQRAALIVIDMQNDFCSPGGMVDQRGGDYRVGRAPIAPLQRLLPALRAAGTQVIWVNWGNRPDLANLPPHQLYAFERPGKQVGLGDPLPGNRGHILQKDSWSAAVVDELPAAPRDLKVDKYRLNGFHDTPLDGILRNLGTRTVFFAGVNTDQCVFHSLTAASFLGYGCVLLEDCCASSSPPFCTEATLWNIKKCFGFVSDSARLLAALASAPAGENAAVRT